jgi:hypothetical protein
MISEYEFNDEILKIPRVFNIIYPEYVTIEDGETIKNELAGDIVTSTIIKKDGSIRATYRGKINGKLVELKEVKPEFVINKLPNRVSGIAIEPTEEPIGNFILRLLPLQAPLKPGQICSIRVNDKGQVSSEIIDPSALSLSKHKDKLFSEMTTLELIKECNDLAIKNYDLENLLQEIKDMQY